MVKASSPFLKFTAICGLLLVLSTLGIHLFFSEITADFETKATIFKKSTYILQRWWIIIYCLLVLGAMWGFFLTQYRKSIGFACLDFVFFGIIALAEIARQMFDGRVLNK